MSFVQPSWGSLVSFTAALRKPLLIPSGYFSPNQDTGWIWSIPTANGTPVTLTGTVDGVNTVFTSSITITNGIAIFRNGVLQQPGVMYSTSGSNTITFIFPYIPQTGDQLQAFVGSIAGTPFANATTPITVGASPFVYTCGPSPVTVYISGGAVSLVTKNGVSLTNAFPISIPLTPGEAITVTYTVAPYMVSAS